MTNNEYFNNFVEKMKPFHNHICILYDYELVRLIGVHKDETDFYYLVKYIGFDKPISYCSAVGHIISMNGIYPEDRYQHMDDIFEMNGATKENTFIVTEE